MKRSFIVFWLVLLIGLLSGCVSQEKPDDGLQIEPTLTLSSVQQASLEALSTPTQTPVRPEATATQAPSFSTQQVAVSPTKTVTSTLVPAASSTVEPVAATTAAPEPVVNSAAGAQIDLTTNPDDWKNLPVIPQLSPHALAVIQAGVAQGHNPRAFSKIGDCESQASWFLGDFDLGPKNYRLGPYENDFTPVIDYYQGSFNRLSLAAKPGFTSASVMSLLWADPKTCEKNETPLGCEYRLNKPILAFIMLGTNDASNPKTFEGHMRKIIEYSISQGVLPVLGTKADNAEGNEVINQTIARLALEYDIPLWNYWRAVQDLPGHGLQEDGLHLTFGPTQFDNPENLQKAWPVRNINAMQILKMVMEQTQSGGGNE